MLSGMEEMVHAGQEITVQEWSEPARLISRSLLLDITVNQDRVIAVGDRGHVLLSSDHGENWTQVLVPTQSMLNAVTTINGRHCWTVGYDATILHSTDYGETWIQQSFNPEKNTPLFDVWFGEVNRGVAVGAYGLAVTTYDGGGNWEPLTISKQDPHLYGITESPQHKLFVVGEFGSIFRSEDLGKTWQALANPYKGPFFGIFAHSNGTLLVFGLQGTIFRSKNNGENWQRIKSGTRASLLSSGELNDGSIIIFGSDGTMLHSQDEGRNFLSATPAVKNDTVAIALTSQGHLLTVGGSGITHIKNPLSLVSKENRPH